MIGPNRNHGAFVTQYDFSDPSANHPNSVLAGSNTFDDRYVCIPYFILDRSADVVALHKAELHKRIRNRNAAHAGTRGRRDFTSRSSLQAGQYAVTVTPDQADAARQLVVRLGWQNQR